VEATPGADEGLLKPPRRRSCRSVACGFLLRFLFILICLWLVLWIVSELNATAPFYSAEGL
jgi:hypothetical protein